MPESPAADAARGAPALQTLLRSALWLLLGCWIGGFLFFAFAVAPTAFHVLPSTEIAGTLVGPVLAALHLYGVVAGPLLAVLALALRRGPLCWALPLAMAAACAWSHFGVTAEIEGLRDLAFGPHGNEQAAARFNELHRLSMGIFTAVGLGAIALIGLHSHADARIEARSRGS